MSVDMGAMAVIAMWVVVIAVVTRLGGPPR